MPISTSCPALRPARLRAATLPATLLVVAAIVSLLSISVLLTSQFGRYAGRQDGVGMEAACCDAALEYIYAQWINVIKVSGGTIAPDSATIASKLSSTGFLSAFPAGNQMNIDPTSLTMTLKAVDQNGMNAKDGTPIKKKTQNIPGYPGWTGFTYNYVATVTLKSTAYGTQGEIYCAKRYFQALKIPLCQGLGFYNNVMEVHPGATMILTGPIHSNDSIYAQGMGAFLQFKDSVSYSNKFVEGTSNPSVTRGWSGENTTGSANPDVYAPYTPVLWADGLPTNYNAYNKLNPSTARQSQLNKVGTINPFGTQTTTSNGLHDLVEKPATYGANNQLVYNNAALVVEINSNLALNDANRVSIYVNTSGTLNKVTGGDDYTNVMSAIGSGAVTGMYDQRESSTAVLTNLDMDKLDTATTLNANSKKVTALQTAFNQPGQPRGGTVYIHDVAPKTAVTRPAVRLINGRDLGQNVSVATDNPLYILGDYNTGGNSASDVPSNVSNNDGTAVPQASGYNRYASAVMADAVTILSNNWKDGNAGQALKNRTAVATTVNTAILAGDVASNNNNSGIASGGLHNFPRFLESWQNVNFTYYGSLIEAFNSETATGYWQTNQVYYWPMRKWNFDTNFNQTQPYGMPQGAKTSRGRWERFFPLSS